jgi:energy-converting hydrogenase Eha subunit A
MDETVNSVRRDKRHTGALSTASFLLSLAAVLVVVLSIRRVEQVQHLPGCLVEETGGYKVIHSLCTILPTGSLAAGVVALVRALRGRRKLRSIIPAAGGVFVSSAVLVVYWVNLARLASEHVH